MDALDQAVQSERAWIGRCEDAPALLDRMAAYRQTARAAARAGDAKARIRVEDLLELAEDRIAELKARALCRSGAPRAAAAVAVTSAPPAIRSPDEELRATRSALAASQAAHRVAVRERDEAERREREASDAHDQERRRERREREASDAHDQERRREQQERDALRRQAEASAEQQRQRAADRARSERRARGGPADGHPETAPGPSGVPPGSPPVRVAPHRAGGEKAAPPVQRSVPVPVARPFPRLASLPRDAPPARVHLEGAPTAPPPLTGADLAAFRRGAGLTQVTAAQLLGVTQGTISKAEGNPRAVLGPGLQEALGRAVR